MIISYNSLLHWIMDAVYISIEYIQLLCSTIGQNRNQKQQERKNIRRVFGSRNSAGKSYHVQTKKRCYSSCTRSILNCTYMIDFFYVFFKVKTREFDQMFTLPTCSFLKGSNAKPWTTIQLSDTEKCARFHYLNTVLCILRAKQLS